MQIISPASSSSSSSLPSLSSSSSSPSPSQARPRSQSPPGSSPSLAHPTSAVQYSMRTRTSSGTREAMGTKATQPRGRSARSRLMTSRVLSILSLACLLATTASSSNVRALEDTQWPTQVQRRQNSVVTTTESYTASPSTVTATTVASGAGSTSGALNAPETSASTTEASASSAASTSVPSLSFSSTEVPYLFQQPLADEADASSRPMVQTFFKGCEDSAGLNQVSAESRINVSAVYAQYDPNPDAATLEQLPHTGVLRIVGVGAVANESYGASTDLFSAIQVSSSFLTFDVFSNLTYLCDELYPTSPDEDSDLTGHSTCTYGPGEVSFGVSIPLNYTYQLGTIWTQILLIDSSSPAESITCIDVPVTPYSPEAWYWKLIFWLPIALFIGFFVTVSSGRAITAAATRARAFKNRAREGSAPSFLRDHISPIIISAISGQGMVLSPALLRFATPGCWEILTHLQFIAAIAMVAVSWPDFSYPFFARAAWASLVGNVTIVQASGEANPLVDPLATYAYLPAGDIGTAMESNMSSPVFMNSSASSALLNLNSTYTGIPAFASVVGLHPSDLFGTCLFVWLVIVAIFVAVAILGWVIDTIALAAKKLKQQREGEALDYQLADEDSKTVEVFINADGTLRDNRSAVGGFLGAWPRGARASPHLHWAALHGNIVRSMTIFHLPITIFSVYQFANAGEHTTKTVGLAALAFAIISVLMPAYLVWRIAHCQARKLYDDIETLLALGPVYNTFSPGSQLFCAITFAHSLIIGIVIGAGQASGTAQSIVVLVFEVLVALAQNLWLPWGEGAMMGPISFVTSVFRIITTVLVVLLCPLVDMGTRAAGWITYVILLIQGIFFVGATLILAVKLIESVIRLVGRVSYDEGGNSRSGGIGGAIRRIRRRRDKILQLNNPKRSNKGQSKHRMVNSQGSSIMLSDATKRYSSGGTSILMTPTSSMGGYKTLGMASPGVSPNGMPIDRSRHPSIASYLEFGNAVASNGLSPAAASGYPSKGPSGDTPHSQAGGAYMAYFQHDADEGKGTQLTPMGVASSQGGGFQRVGGGRASEIDPWAALAGGAAAGAAASRGQLRFDGAGQTPPGVRSTSNGHSSTSAAAQFSRAYSQRLQNGPRRGSGSGEPNLNRDASKKKLGLFSSRRRRPSNAEEDYFTSDDENDLAAITWNSSTLSTQHGPWNGLVKMQAALSAMRNRLAGRPGDADGTIGSSTEDNSLTPRGGSGFQVIRERRPPAGSGANALSKLAEAQEAEDQNSGLLDSTGLAASTSRPASAMDMQKQASQGSAGPLESGSDARAATSVPTVRQELLPYDEAPQEPASQLYSSAVPRLGTSGSVFSEDVDGRLSPEVPSRISATPPLLELRHLAPSPVPSYSRDEARGSSDSRVGNGWGAGGHSRAASALSLNSQSPLNALPGNVKRAFSRGDPQAESTRSTGQAASASVPARSDTMLSQSGNEDRFWLPPNRLSGMGSVDGGFTSVPGGTSHGGEGVFHPEMYSTAGAAQGQDQTRRSHPLQGGVGSKIELADSDED